jgi:hypothetical protein
MHKNYEIFALHQNVFPNRVGSAVGFENGGGGLKKTCIPYPIPAYR